MRHTPLEGLHFFPHVVTSVWASVWLQEPEDTGPAQVVLVTDAESQVGEQVVLQLILARCGERGGDPGWGGCCGMRVWASAWCRTGGLSCYSNAHSCV